MNPIVVPAKLEHCHKLAKNIRKADADEMWAQAGWRAEEGVVFSFEQSDEVYTVIDADEPDDVPLLMFGLGRSHDIIDSQNRSIWLLGTERAKLIKKRFVKECAAYMITMAAGYTVYNFVLSTNHESLRWLKWLGFTIMEAKPHGWLKKPFHYVERTVPCAYSQQPPQPV